jgi:hypothetical protein
MLISLILSFLFVVIYDLCCLYCSRLFCLVKLYSHYIAYAEIASPCSISICFFRVSVQHCYYLILFHCIFCWLLLLQNKLDLKLALTRLIVLSLLISKFWIIFLSTLILFSSGIRSWFLLFIIYTTHLSEVIYDSS